jgi:hypothetical protein
MLSDTWFVMMKNTEPMVMAGLVKNGAPADGAFRGRCTSQHLGQSGQALRPGSPR